MRRPLTSPTSLVLWSRGMPQSQRSKTCLLRTSRWKSQSEPRLSSSCYDVCAARPLPRPPGSIRPPRKESVGRVSDPIHPPPYTVWGARGHSATRQRTRNQVDLKRLNKPLWRLLRVVPDMHIRKGRASPASLDRDGPLKCNCPSLRCSPPPTVPSSPLGMSRGAQTTSPLRRLLNVRDTSQCTSQRTSPGLPTPSLSPRRHNSAYTFSAGWKEQASLHPSSPPSTGVPLRACWPAASLSGTETAVQQTARPSSGQWTPLQKSLVPLSPPSWTFSLHDAPAKQKVLWRTPPTPPTVSSSSSPQVDGTGVSEPAPPDCSTAFSPRLWEPWTHITPPLSETPNNKPPPPPPTLPHLRKKLLNLYLCGIQVSGPAQATCSNTCSNTHMH